MFSRIRHHALLFLLVFAQSHVSGGDAVLAEICEQGLADKDAWRKVAPTATESSY